MTVLGILASHRGTTLQAVIDACAQGVLNARIGLVISNNKSSQALTRAELAQIPALHISSGTAGDDDKRDGQMRAQLLGRGCSMVLLAGYMKKLGSAVISAYPNRILNTHPGLLPKYGGQGMYGQRVHEAVIAAGESETGVTLHLVNSEYDRGATVACLRLPVLQDDNAETLAARVQTQEKLFLIEQLQRLIAEPSLLDRPAP